MSLILLILGLALVGLLVYLLETNIPMSPPFKIAIRVVVIVALILYLAQLFGLDLRVPRLR